MARPAVRVIDRGWDREIRNTTLLARRGIRLGVQAGATNPESGFDLVDILIWNEFGARGIPARPVMRSYFDNNVEAIAEQSRKAALFVFRTGATDLALQMVGEFMQSGLKKHWLASKTWAIPNAPYTVWKKGSDKPLIDHGYLIGAIRWEKT